MKDLLSNLIPISSALLSFIVSIMAAYITKKIASSEARRNTRMTIKLNDIEIEINERNKEEVLELITKLKDEDELKKLELITKLKNDCKKEA